MRPYFYILDAELRIVPVECERWSRWFESQQALGLRGDIAIGATVVRTDGSTIDLKEFPEMDLTVSDVRVSTIFLGLDHNFSPFGPPVLFKTMVFGGELNEVQFRTRTWSEARAKHAEVLEAVLAAASVTNKRPSHNRPGPCNGLASNQP